MIPLISRERSAAVTLAILFSILAIGSNQPLADEISGDQSVDASSLTFPDGATRIVELFGDWTLNCEIRLNQKECVVQQARGNQAAHTVALAISVRASTPDRAQLVLSLPPLAPAGTAVSLDLDGNPLAAKQPLDTCTDKSCARTFTISAAPFAALRTGKNLNVRTFTPGGQSADKPIALKGFASAIKRSIELSN
jgi:invasion protein IalB